MTPEQQLFDELLANGLDILRLGVAERNLLLARMARLEKALLALLNEEDLTKARRREINTVIRNANVVFADYYKEFADDVDVTAIAEYSADATVLAFEIAYGLDSIKLPKSDYFKSLASDILIQGAPSADWWRAQEADAAFKFAAQLRLGLTAGETNQEIISRIVGKNGQPGIMDVLKRNAATLVQTSVQTVANDARRNTFAANDDIVKGLQQVSTLDGHTSIVCVSYSGAKWNMKYEPIDGNTLPFNGGTPRHFSCRSLEIPITKTFRELGLDIDEAPGTTRASADGQIAVDTTFDGFLTRKGTKYQDKVLGEGRAALWRAGKITLRDLVNGQGKPVGLDYLNALVKKRRGG